MPLIVRLYVTGAEHGLQGMLFRGFVAGLAMLPSTILMGASLPATVRWIESTRRGVSWWALLYGSNTAGAVSGCLLAGFYLLRVHNMATATYVAAAINLLVAATAFRLAGVSSQHTGFSEPDGAATFDRTPYPLWSIYLGIALSGACALGAEVIFTRVLGILLMATVYAFSIILAVFLTGLAGGAAVSSWLIRKMAPGSALGWCQLLVTSGIAWAAMIIEHDLPGGARILLLSPNPWRMFFFDMAFCAWAILPPAILWGASFPLACAAAVRSPKQDSARVAGTVYAANTLGSIVGALVVSIVLIPWLGVQGAQRVVLSIAGLAGLLVLLSSARSKTMALPLAIAMGGIAWMAYTIPAVPPEMIAFGRRAGSFGLGHVIYVAEGRNSSVAITKFSLPQPGVGISVNGHVEATTDPVDMRLQRMVAHLPGLAHPHPMSVLGIGFGAGVSAGSFTRYPGMRHITICEIEPVIPPASARFFGPQNYDVYHDPRTQIVYDDARHYLLTTNSTFDIIASDPLDVFAKGTAALYTREYFEVVKRRLNPGGLFSLYVPLYEADEPTVRSELETFFQAFPNATLWSNTRRGKGYDMVFMATLEPLRLNLDEVQQRLARPEYAPVLESLRDTGFPSIFDLFGTWSGQKNDVGRWSSGADINTDANLRLSYLAGLAINSFAADELYRKITQYREDPAGVFTGSPGHLSALRDAIRRQAP
jgi:spermidine synthase